MVGSLITLFPSWSPFPLHCAKLLNWSQLATCSAKLTTFNMGVYMHTLRGAVAWTPVELVMSLPALLHNICRLDSHLFHLICHALQECFKLILGGVTRLSHQPTQLLV